MARDVAKEGNGALALSGVSQALIGANLNRQGLIVCNTSGANVMWLALQEAPTTSGGPAVLPTAAANTGVKLAANQTVNLSDFRGALAVIGTAADVCTFVEY